MSQDFKAIFEKLPVVTPPAGLSGMILIRIEKEQKRSARRELIATGILSLASLGGIIPAFNYLVSGFGNSGFSAYLSLVLTDGLSVVSFWREIILSLAESLPLMSLVAFLSVLVVLIWSIARASRDVKVGFLAA